MPTDPDLVSAVRLHIYKHFVDTGRAATATDIAQALVRDVVNIEEALLALADAHAIVLAPGTRSIWMAHPFSAVPTPYCVQSGNTAYSANCAWDALGIAAILGQDTECFARCPDCGECVDLSVKRDSVAGKGVIHFAVPPRRFWDNVAYT